MFQLTHRAIRMIRLAEQCKPPSRDVLIPQDIFVGALKENTGVLGELVLRGRFNLMQCQDVRYREEVVSSSLSYPPFQCLVSNSVVRVMEKARAKARHYNQGFISEGHILEALLEFPNVARLLRCSGSQITRNDVLQIACSPRNMAVHLESCVLDLSPAIGTTTIRRATVQDLDPVLSYVQSEFGVRWMATVQAAFQETTIPLFLALENQDILGFACYDVVDGKKGLFGPMGTSRRCRQSGVGKALLHQCLAEMKALGYDYAIIKHAGPMEFYERACGAVLIPLNAS